MPAPITPRNPKGAGRKPSPAPNRETASFRPTEENRRKLETYADYKFKDKTDLINYALRMFFDTYENPNAE